MHTRCSGLQPKMHTRNTDAVRLSSAASLAIPPLAVGCPCGGSLRARGLKRDNRDHFAAPFPSHYLRAPIRPAPPP